MGQVLTDALTIIAPDQEEKVLEELRPSFGPTLPLVKKGNESRACAVKEVTTDQPCRFSWRFITKPKVIKSDSYSINIWKHFSKEERREMIPGRLRKWQIYQSLFHAAEEAPKKSVVSARIKSDEHNLIWGIQITSSTLLLVHRTLPMAELKLDSG